MPVCASLCVCVEETARMCVRGKMCLCAHLFVCDTSHVREDLCEFVCVCIQYQLNQTNREE